MKKSIEITLLLMFLLCLIDVRFFGVTVSMWACFVFSIFNFRIKKIKKEFFRDSILVFLLIYILILIFNYFFKNITFTLNFIFTNLLNYIFCLCLVTYLQNKNKKNVINTIELFIKITLVLIIFDLLTILISGDTFFLIFASNQIGYKNFQLISNEPNWYAMLIFSLNYARKFLSNNNKIDNIDIIVLICLIFFSSRIVLFAHLLLIVVKFKPKINLRNIFNTLFSFIFIAIIILNVTNIDVFFYDILFIDKNPRINDFLMFLYTTKYLDYFDYFIGTSPGNLYKITGLSNFRNDSTYVVNVLFTQFFFEIGLIGILIFIVMFFRKTYSRLMPFLLILLISLNLHNAFFRQQFWIIWALIIFINYNYKVKTKNLTKNP